MPNLSASLATSNSSVPAGYMVNCHITISNASVTSPITIQQIVPQIKSTPIPFSEDKSSWSFSPVSLEQNPIPASGSREFLLKVVFHGANNYGTYDSSPNNSSYDVSCIIYGSNGEVISPTPLVITVSQNSQEI